jgi:hypothetical protein
MYSRNPWLNDDVEPLVITLSRRDLLILAGAAVAWTTRAAASDSDFWNRKPPADWTPEEIERLLHESPWAKTITPFYTSPPPKTDNRPWGENPPIGQRPPGRSVPGPIPQRKTSLKAPYQAILRWESAEPIRSAQKTRLPAAFDGYHVIAILFRGDVARDLGPKPIEDLKQSVVLAGKRAVDAEIVQAYRAGPDAFLIGFPKTSTTGAKRLEFSASAGIVALKARFNTSGMLYHGQLAL